MQESEKAPEAPTHGDLALFGGVFDPVHRGHLAVARAALERLPVTAVYFLPAGSPPHKTDAAVAAPGHRLAMLRLAVADEQRHGLPAGKRLGVDTRELERTGPSYTVTTLEELHRERPGRRCFFLLGADNVPSLGRWHEAPRILELCIPVVFPRQGQRARFTSHDLPFLGPERIEELNGWRLDVPEVPVSSSEVRRRAAAGRSLDDLVPPAVATYIREHRLYPDREPTR